MTFLILSSNENGRPLRTGAFENANGVPDPGANVVVSLPETGTLAVARVDHVDADHGLIYLDVDEDSRVWL